MLVLVLQFLLPQLSDVPALLGDKSVAISSQPSTATGISTGFPVCPNPKAFPTEPVFSQAHRMALLQEAKRVAADFEYSPDDVRKGVKEFIRQMGPYRI